MFVSQFDPNLKESVKSMKPTKKAIFNWSSGKDSAFALMEVLRQKEYDIHCLLTSVNKPMGRISMHGVRTSLLEAQAQSIGLPLQLLSLPETPSMEDYNALLTETMKGFTEAGITHSIFGDINLEDLRKYREDQLATVGIQAVFPLWQRDTSSLIKAFIDSGFKAVVSCINNTYLDPSFAGRLLDHAFLNDLPENVDPCGENGEFHTFVFDGPVFSSPIRFEIGEVVFKEYKTEGKAATHDTGFYFCDLIEK